MPSKIQQFSPTIIRLNRLWHIDSITHTYGFMWIQMYNMSVVVDVCAAAAFLSFFLLTDILYEILCCLFCITFCHIFCQSKIESESKAGAMVSDASHLTAFLSHSMSCYMMWWAVHQAKMIRCNEKCVFKDAFWHPCSLHLPLSLSPGPPKLFFWPYKGIHSFSIFFFHLLHSRHVKSMRMCFTASGRRCTHTHIN